MGIIKGFFGQPGMVVTFVKDVHGARHCLADRRYTAVGLRLGQEVEFFFPVSRQGKKYQNVGHAFKEVNGSKTMIPHNEENSLLVICGDYK